MVKAYGEDINDSVSLTQEDKEEIDHGHTQQSVPKLERIYPKCKKSIHAVSKKEMVKELRMLKLHTSGSRQVLYKRLHMYNRKKNLCTPDHSQQKSMFDFYVVIDFEATCDNHQKIKPDDQEIIEFPAILLNCMNGKLEDEFQFYCRPTLNPVLTHYCTELTGITQGVVNEAPSFPEVLASFNDWLRKKNLGSMFSFAIVTDGTKDMGHFLKRQCALSNITFPEYGKYWINIRREFSKFYNIDIQDQAFFKSVTVLNAMLLEIGRKFKGRAHSGLDDARNIAFIVQYLLEDGASLTFNEKLPEKGEDKNRGKRVFALPVLQEELKRIKDTLKSNFPSKCCPTKAVMKPSMTEAASKSSKLSQTVQFAKENGVKTHRNGAELKNPSKDSSSTTVLKRMPTKDVLSKSKIKTPSQTAVEGINGNMFAKISESSTTEKTTEVLAKELKLANKEFYSKIQYSKNQKRIKVAKKNMEFLKKCLKVSRLKDAACVSIKPRIEDETTRRMISMISNVAEEQEAVDASGKQAYNSQKVAKKKASSVKMGNQSETKGSLTTVLHNMETSLHGGTISSHCVQDVEESTAKSVSFDNGEEELFFGLFEKVLHKGTMSDRKVQ